jgi:hypothetical protein
METWSEAVRAGAVSGSWAAVVSGGALAVCAALEGAQPLSPLNGPSQWVWGQRAAQQTRVTVRHTALGYVIHHASAVLWAVLHEKMHGEVRARTSMPVELARAGATTAVAAFVDYGLTPKRFQPGFDKHLSLVSIAAVYAAFALGLAAARMRRHHATDRKDD